MIEVIWAFLVVIVFALSIWATTTHLRRGQ